MLNQIPLMPLDNAHFEGILKRVKMNFLMTAVTITMLVCISKAKGQIDRSQIKATTTNIDLLFPTKGQTKAESCFVYSRGVDAKGNKHSTDSLGDLIVVYAASACQDTSEQAGLQKKIFIWQIQEVAQAQTDSIYKVMGKGKKVRIITDDLSKKQRDDIKLNKKYMESLGNFRLEIK